MDSTTEGQVCGMAEPGCSSSVWQHLKNIHFTKAENTYENGGSVLGLFSEVINKVCGK